jgi:hypothetical protein
MDGFGSSFSSTWIECPNADMPLDWVDNNFDLDDNFYCLSNEFLDMYQDLDSDNLGCGDFTTYCIDDLTGPGWVSNNEDLDCNCTTNDTDDCGVCGGNNDCIGCMDTLAFNYSPDVVESCDECWIDKDNYPDWDVDGDSILDKYSIHHNFLQHQDCN